MRTDIFKTTFDKERTEASKKQETVYLVEVLRRTRETAEIEDV